MIAIKTQPAEGDLFGQSKWWGFPDLPEELDWPSVPVNDEGDVYDDTLTFICQIRCEEPRQPGRRLPGDGGVGVPVFPGALFERPGFAA